jgi:ATP-binding cassette subfamily B protein
LILVLKDGELVEQGRYAELVARGGLFAELDASGRFVPDAEDPTDSYAEPTLTAV